MNILDYIDWRGDITFAERGFNEVDNLIFSELAYLPMDGLVPDEGITLRELGRRCDEAGVSSPWKVNDPIPTMRKAAASERFGGVFISDYVNRVDVEREVQFAAVRFRYDEGRTYVAFRGTDNTIVGWREDMNFSFVSGTPGQLMAAEYLDSAAEDTEDELIVGGHSKGGNFAEYGAAYCSPETRERISTVYSNDGPGFNRAVADSKEYNAILGRVRKIIPDSSLVGILLSSRAECTVIKSSAKGVMQHDPYSWSVWGTAFERADERTASSVFMDDTLKRWVATLSDDELRVLADTLFDVLEATGATTLNEIGSNKPAAYNAILKAMTKVEPAKRSELFEMFRKLLISGKDAAVAGTRKSLELSQE